MLCKDLEKGTAAGRSGGNEDGETENQERRIVMEREMEMGRWILVSSWRRIGPVLLHGTRLVLLSRTLKVSMPTPTPAPNIDVWLARRGGADLAMRSWQEDCASLAYHCKRRFSLLEQRAMYFPLSRLSLSQHLLMTTPCGRGQPNTGTPSDLLWRCRGEGSSQASGYVARRTAACAAWCLYFPLCLPFAQQQTATRCARCAA